MSIDTEKLFVAPTTQEQIDDLRRLIELLQQNLLAKSTAKVGFASTTRTVLATSALVAGESIANGDAVRLGLTNELTRELLSTGSNEAIGNDGAGGADKNISAQSFKWHVAITTVKFKLWLSNGDPSNRTVNAYIVADNAGEPTGSVLYGPVGVSIISGAAAEYTYDFGTVALVAGTTYWLVLHMTTSTGTNPLIYYGGTATSEFAVHKHSTDGGSSYSTVGTELYIRMYVTEDNTKVYKGDAQTADIKNLYFGIANNAAINAGDTIEVIVEGMKEDYAETITVGAKYYLTNTRGTIGTAAGSETKQVGLGLRTRSLYIHSF